MSANTYASINLITREAVQLFVNSNSFLMNLDLQYASAFATPEPVAVALSAKEIAAFGLAAMIAKNPIVTRRFLPG